MGKKNQRITLKVTYNKVYDTNATSQEKVIHVGFDEVFYLSNKERLIAFLRQYLDLGEERYVTIIRKSRKNKDYVPLHSEKDFKALFRSLRVKNHTKLVINDSCPRTFTSMLAHDDNKWAGIDFSSFSEAILDSAKLHLRGVLSDFTDKICEGTDRTQVSQMLGDCMHLNASCDMCTKDEFVPIRGVRYKCLVCQDYDLCLKCESLQFDLQYDDGHHSFRHPMAKISIPDSLSSYQRYNLPRGCAYASISCDRAPATSINRYHELLRADELCDGKYKRDSERLQKLLSKVRLSRENSSDDLKYNFLQTLVEGSENDVFTDTFEANGCSNAEEFGIFVNRKYANFNVLIITLWNRLSESFCGKEINFKFYDDQSTEEILISNPSPIKPGEKRTFGVGVLYDKFVTEEGGRISISNGSNDFRLEGYYKIGSYNRLDKMKSNLENQKNSTCTDSVQPSNCVPCLAIKLISKSDRLCQLHVFNNSQRKLECKNLSFKLMEGERTIFQEYVPNAHAINANSFARFNLKINRKELGAASGIGMKTNQNDFFFQIRGRCHNDVLLAEQITTKLKISALTDQSISTSCSSVEDMPLVDIGLEKSNSEENINRESTHSLVLPLISKCAKEGESGRVFIRSETSNGSDCNQPFLEEDKDYDVISIDGDTEEILDSDYEVLSPMNSN